MATAGSNRIVVRRRCFSVPLRKRTSMLRWAIVFLIIALIAGTLGILHVEWMARQIAWVLFVVFLILFVVSPVVGRRPPLVAEPSGQ